MNVGDLIVSARQGAGLTQVELARRAHTSQAAIARYETGHASPSVATLERVLRAAGRRLELRVASVEPVTLATEQARCLRRHRKEILDIARRHGARNVRLFGSVVRGDARPDSDIDLLVDLDVERVGLMPVVRLREELAALLGFQVDVAPLSTLAPEVARVALAEAMTL